MKTFFQSIWNCIKDIGSRIMNLQSTTIGLCIGAVMFYFLVHVLNEKMATFAEIVPVILVIGPIVFGALFRENNNNNQPPTLPPNLPTI